MSSNFYELNWRFAEACKNKLLLVDMSDLRSANLLAPLCGWLPSLFGSPRPSSTAPAPSCTKRSASAPQTALGCRRALVGLLLWLSPSWCSRCARQRPKEVEPLQTHHESESPTTFSPSCSVFAHHFHSLHSSRQTHWIDGCRGFHTMNIDCLCPLHPLMAMALFQTKRFFFITSAFFLG